MKTLIYYPLYTIIILSSIPQTARSENGGFTIVNGQIFTPGLAILDSPQPFTPLGGDTLQIAIDISGDGRIPLSNPPTTSSPTFIHNITIFLTSYTTIHNFTISNNTSPPPSTNTPAFIGPILSLEPSSTVKHINWFWPACLVGNGAPTSPTLGTGTGTEPTSARGEYNISIHQSFRLNGSEFYTVFDLPISVTNEIPQREGKRVECPFLENILLPPEEIRLGTDTLPTQPFLGGGVSISGAGTGTGSLGSGEGSGSSSGEGGSSGTETGGKDGDGDGDLTALLAEGSGRVGWSTSMMLLVGAAMYFIMLL